MFGRQQQQSHQVAVSRTQNTINTGFKRIFTQNLETSKVNKLVFKRSFRKTFLKLCHILTSFEHSFTVRLSDKFAFAVWCTSLQLKGDMQRFFTKLMKK